MARSDLADYRAEWVTLSSTSYRGHTVYALPPNSQGFTVLEILNILEGFDLKAMGYQTADFIHCLVEATKIAFADRNRYLVDPKFGDVPLHVLLSKDYAAQRRQKIDFESAGALPAPYLPGDTATASVIDSQGNAVSFVQSIAYDFGSGIVAGDTGIVLQNRGMYFSLEVEDLNCIEPFKRPKHTLCPTMVFTNNQLSIVLGASGGDGQPQTQLQVLTGVVDFGLNLQEAIEHPRWISGLISYGIPAVWQSKEVAGVLPPWVNKTLSQANAPSLLFLEGRYPAEIADDLERRGQTINTVDDWAVDWMGHAQGIVLFNKESGVMLGGTDPRIDGLVLPAS
jgi:gamma-glutamyltranspeptidase/glutathione hydrolase